MATVSHLSLYRNELISKKPCVRVKKIKQNSRYKIEVAVVKSSLSKGAVAEMLESIGIILNKYGTVNFEMPISNAKHCLY